MDGFERVYGNSHEVPVVYQRQKNFCSFYDSCSFVDYYEYSGANAGHATATGDDDQYNAFYENAAAYQNANAMWRIKMMLWER